MPYDPRRHNRQSHRLADYDYPQPGAYFITMCTQDRLPLFGQVVEGEMRLSPAGRIVEEVLGALAQRYTCVRLDAFVVMPDHVHGIIWIVEVSPDGQGCPGVGGVRAIHESPRRGEEESPRPGADDSSERTQKKRRRMLIPLVVGYFKMNTAKRINQLRSTPGTRVWQRDYYERVIRNERHLYAVRRYIGDNPACWAARKEAA
jgi:putative transposase